MKGVLIVACTLATLTMAPAAHAEVTIGSSLAPTPGPPMACAMGCSVSATAIPGQLVAAPSSGVISQWSIKAGAQAPAVRLVVLRRPAGAGAQPGQLVAGSAQITPTPNEITPTAVRIPVAAGEFIGIEWSGDGAFVAPTAQATQDVWSPPLTVDLSAPTTPAAADMELLVNADIEPDRDGDGFGDETQDNCGGTFNPDQNDADGDGVGDACDPDADRDGDGFPNASDVCPTVAGTANGCPAQPATPTPPRVNTPAIVRFKTPLVGTTVGPSQLIELEVFDDFGAPSVTVFDDDGTVCTLNGPPYSCTWQPTGADVGRATLLASAVDADRRSSLGSVRVRVAKFEADLTSKRRGRKVTGRLVLPQVVEKALGCKGEVTVRRKKVRRIVKLKRNCTFSVRLPPGKGKPKARFAGNSVVEPAT